MNSVRIQIQLRALLLCLCICLLWANVPATQQQRRRQQVLATSIYKASHPTIHLSIHLSVHPSIHPSMQCSKSCSAARWPARCLCLSAMAVSLSLTHSLADCVQLACIWLNKQYLLLLMQLLLLSSHNNYIKLRAPIELCLFWILFFTFPPPTLCNALHKPPTPKTVQTNMLCLKRTYWTYSCQSCYCCWCCC